ncbi:MAG: DUF4293 domain-containing protein [Bacteroidota bacterium]
MIQRIQTLFLIGVIILMGLSMVFGHWFGANDSTSLRIFSFFAIQSSGPDNSQILYPYTWIGIFGSLSILVAVIEIFLFKNRLLQMKLGLLNSLLIGLCVGSSLFLVWRAQNDLGAYGSYEYGVFFPLAAIILNRFATRFIKKDEDLIRSVDRIR